VAELSGLTPFQSEILDHWNQFAPNMVKQLDRQGNLRKRLESVADHANLAYNQGLDGGLAPDQARELTREIWMAPLSDSPDLPDLPATQTTSQG
jgi:hypothetical protein